MYDATHNDRTRPLAQRAAQAPADKAVVGEIVLHGNVVKNHSPMSALADGHCVNDAFYDEAANAPWAATVHQAPGNKELTGYELHRAVRARRAALLGNLASIAARSVGEFLRRALGRLSRWRRARATYHALSRLDDHTLRDIGLDRSELAPFAWELKTEALYLQVRGSVGSNSFPR